MAVLECAVSDNGVGRVRSEELNRNSKSHTHKSTALLVTRERLDLYGEIPGLQSLEIIDLYDEHGEAARHQSNRAYSHLMIVYFRAV